MLLFTIFSTALVLCAVAFSTLSAPLPPIGAGIALVALSSLLYAACVWAAGRCNASRPGVASVFAFSLLLRAAVWFAPPAMTTDFYRYAWDAKVAAHGVNPYKYAPSSVELKDLRTRNIYDGINFKRCPTSYGPVAQVFFKFMRAAGGEDPHNWRIAFFLIDLLNIILLAALMRALGFPAAGIVIYAYNPLVLLELCANMHLDGLMIAFILLSALLAVRGRSPWWAVPLAGATLIKYFPMFLFPAFLMLAREHATENGTKIKILNPRALAAAGLFAILVGAGFLAYMEKGVDLFAGLKFFSSELKVTYWSPFYFIEQLLGGGTARAVSAISLAAASILFLPRGKKEIIGRIFAILALTALLSPVQRPWYFLWALPMCCVRMRVSWLALTCAVPLTYSVLYNADAIYTSKIIVYSFFYAVLFVEAAKRLRHALMREKT